MTHLLLGNLPRAREYLEQAPESPAVLNDRATLALRQARHQEALGLAERALQASPNQPQATWNRALALDGLRQSRPAAEAFERAARLSAGAGWSEEARSRADRLWHELSSDGRRRVKIPMETRHLSGGVAASIVAAVAGAVMLVLGLPSIVRRAHALLAARTLFEPLARNPYRRNDLRLTYALADRYRPHSVLRREPPPPAAQLPFRYSHVSLARLERVGDQQGIAVAYALAGDLARARQILEPLVAENADQRPGNLAVDLAAVLVWNGQGSGRAEALRLLDGVLRRQPAHPQATWNRAVLLEYLDLPVAAARQFREVADLGEPGWADEAKARADRLPTLG